MCIIDDYHHFHTVCQPDSEKTSSGANMCTTVIGIFPSIRAIPRGDPLQVHNPKGISVNKLLDTLCSAESMQRIAESFASTMPD